jgi:hypothetical protein
MSQAQQHSTDGVPVQLEAGTPSPLPSGQSADALETIEFAAVVELVAGYAVGPLGAARVRGRRPTDDLAWIGTELARVGEVAGLFRRGDALLAEPVPDVTRGLGRLRIAGSVLDGPELAALHRLLVAGRQVQADLRRVADAAPLASALVRPLPDKAIERRLELSIDQDGTLLDSASPRLAGARSTPPGSGCCASSSRCCAGSMPTPPRPTRTSPSAADATSSRFGATPAAGPAASFTTRAGARVPCSSSPRRPSSSATRCARRRWMRSARYSACCAS